MAAIAIQFTAAPKTHEQAGLLRSNGLPLNSILFVEAYLALCADSNGAFVGTAPLIAKLSEIGVGNSAANISKAIKLLTTSGAAIDRHIVNEQGKRQRNIHIKDVSPLVSHFVNQNCNTMPRQRTSKNKRAELAQKLESGGEEFFDLSSGAEPRIEKHFSMYDAAMKTGGHDKRKHIKVSYQLGRRDFIDITAVTTSGDDDDIAHLSDQRAMRVLNGFLYEAARVNNSPKEPGFSAADGYITFDIADLCFAMGLNASESNRNIARGMLRRLAATEFRIDAENSPYYRQTMGGFDLMRYRYLTEFSAVTENTDIDGLAQRAERIYRVRLHGEIVKSLLNTQQSYLSHAGLTSERSGLAQRLYNWSKAVIGVSVKSRIRTYTLEDFHTAVLPAARIDNFKRDFFALLSRFQEPPTSPFNQASKRNIKALIYGYYYTVVYDDVLYEEASTNLNKKNKTNNKAVVIVQRDPSDKLIGDNSAHNQTVRRTAGQSIGMVAHDDA